MSEDQSAKLPQFVVDPANITAVTISVPYDAESGTLLIPEETPGGKDYDEATALEQSRFTELPQRYFAADSVQVVDVDAVKPLPEPQDYLDETEGR